VPMASLSQRNQRPAGSARVSRRQAQEARAQLAAGGLSHHEQRRLRTLLRSHGDTARRRRRRIKRIAIAGAAAAVVMLIVAVYFGLIPAIEAAFSDGTTGSFVVGQHECLSRTGCQWVGTFQYGSQTVTGVGYAGGLPSGDGPGSVIPARYPGGYQVYALHGSHTWVFDLLITLLIGLAAGAALWISPVGDRDRGPAGVRA
jgi:hypothetical protein